MADNSGREILDKYLPAGTSPLITSWLAGHNVQIRFSRGRTSKLGDYRPPINTSVHRISVNNDLNPYALLLTLVHEIAHLKAWMGHGRKIRPHGKEWKQIFRELLTQLVDDGALPHDITSGFLAYSVRIAASGASDQELVKLLRKYDPPRPGKLLEELAMGTVFRVSGGRTFRKKEKLRKRFRCELLPSGKVYLFSPLAVVDPLPEPGE